MMLHRCVSFLFSVCALTFAVHAQPVVDTFGIAQLYPTKAGTRVWTSAHWGNGKVRSFSWDTDPWDPTGWTEDHSGGTDGFRIDGMGTMTMSGSGPRFHINSTESSKVAAQKFLNTEFTAYFMHKGAGQNYGGMVVGARGGPLGHASSGGDDCDATTYYARFRNDGKWDFEKELKHPVSSYWSGSGFDTQDPLWRGAKLPKNRWIGMKYLVYNVNADAHVQLELYIDSVSNGTPVGGGVWTKVGSVIDSGTWNAGDVSGCGYASNNIINPGNGTFVLRTDGDTAVYKMVSIREIELSNTTSLAEQSPRTPVPVTLERVGARVVVRLAGKLVEPSRLRWTSIHGRTLAENATGIAVLEVSTEKGRMRQVVCLPALR